MGRPMLLYRHKETPPRHTGRRPRMSGDHPSKINWERENVIKLTIKINRNQEPELFDLFTREQGSRSALAKTLLRSGLTTQKQEK